jgi:spore coat polysaccharide biosynthesis protein SpsF (cytidylyltransferase family)
MGSTRLPGKVLLPLNGHTVIGEVLTRCNRIPGVDEVVCTIPLGEENNSLADEVRRYCVLHRYPNENDVLARYYNAAWTYEADIIVRVTGDCPLISPEACGAQLAWFKSEAGLDYARSYNNDCEVFSFGALSRAYKYAESDEDREHVGPWMERCCYSVVADNFSLDTEEDYRWILAAFGQSDERVPAPRSDENSLEVAGGA